MKTTLRTARRSPLLQVAKSAIATIAAWAISSMVVGDTPPVFGAIAALLTVQPSISQSFGRGVERTVGVIAGVAVAGVIGVLLGGGFWAIALSILCALLLAWALRATPGTANQVAISAMLVLALGTATPGYALDRVVETAIGAVVGLIVNILIVPPLALDPARSAAGTLASGIAAGLDRLGDALLVRHDGQSLNALLAEARALRSSVASAESALAAALESIALNPRGRRLKAEVAARQTAVEGLNAMVVQLIGMTRAFVDAYDDTICEERQITAIADQLHRAAHDLRRRDSEATGAVEPPALTRPLELPPAPPAHWMLIGSLLVDLRRIHEALAGADGP